MTLARTLQRATLRTADRAAGAIGLLRRKLDAGALMRVAQARTGLSDFGDLSFADPMERLLRAVAEEADLSLVGRIATRWDSLRFLVNLLRMQEAERAAPDIAAIDLGRPIFITGLPRSGTSFLHKLLLEDAANRVPLVWQTIFPYPTPGKPDRRVAEVQGQLDSFERLAPEFHARHPIDALSPQECTEITAHVFRSLRFDTTYDIPGYRAWIDADGHLPAYAFHRRFLRHLQHMGGQAGTRWVLKSPDHVFALPDLRAAYPDAGLVFVHRDPLEVVTSNAHLTSILRAPFSRSQDRLAIGRQESARWQWGTRLMMEADSAAPGRVLHVHYRDLTADPVSAVRRLYAHFGLELPAEAAAAIAARIAEKPRGGYGLPTARPEEYGLDPAAERARFRPYTDHFRIPL